MRVSLKLAGPQILQTSTPANGIRSPDMDPVENKDSDERRRSEDRMTTRAETMAALLGE